MRLSPGRIESMMPEANIFDHTESALMVRYWNSTFVCAHTPTNPSRNAQLS